MESIFKLTLGCCRWLGGHGIPQEAAKSDNRGSKPHDWRFNILQRANWKWKDKNGNRQIQSVGTDCRSPQIVEKEHKNENVVIIMEHINRNDKKIKGIKWGKDRWW